MHVVVFRRLKKVMNTLTHTRYSGYRQYKERGRTITVLTWRITPCPIPIPALQTVVRRELDGYGWTEREGVFVQVMPRTHHEGLKVLVTVTEESNHAKRTDTRLRPEEGHTN